jgi:hypothetical protein
MRREMIRTPHQILFEQSIKIVLGAACGPWEGEKEVCIEILWQNPDRNKPLGIHIGVHERVILKWIFKAYGGTYWADRDKCRGLVNAEIEFLIP